MTCKPRSLIVLGAYPSMASKSCTSGGLIRLPDESAKAWRQPRGFLWLWLLLTFVWIAISSSFALESIVSGALISAAVAHVFSQRFDIWRWLRLSPARIYHYLSYLVVLVVELLRANINMMRYVWAPRLDIDPGIVKVRTRLRSPIGRLALANSISLTPGSLVLDVEKDGFVVHCLDMRTIDPDKASEAIAGPFETLLEKSFG